MPFLPSDDRAFLEQEDYAFSEVEGPNARGEKERGVIIEAWKVPTGLYNVTSVTMMIMIPSGYPDTALDMFYIDPHLITTKTAAHPNYTVTEAHFGRNWQRWSRHYQNRWRAGFDSLETHLTFVRAELAKGQ